MGGRFCFFTDPTLLGAQTAAQAFGPQPAAGGNDRFQLTDLHSITPGAPVFAVCDGLVCAQSDDQGGLTLILKPVAQPPFDFPTISYILYKGVDPASLLAGGNMGSGGVLDTSQAAANQLIDAVQKAWSANGNNGDPTRECLGLHLTAASTAADYPDLDLSAYADSEAIDRLFYQGDPTIQLPLVRAGARLGAFTGSAGLEIVTEHIGYRPKIDLARTRANVLTIASLHPGTTYATDDGVYFMHWHAKEECLNFVDPCSFWGSFFHGKLRVRRQDGSTAAKQGAEIYETILRGLLDDSTPTAGAFFNRNRIYLDIRNEHDRSFNYYKTNGDIILVSLDPSGSIDSAGMSYNSGGWPLFFFDQMLLPAAQSGSLATLRLAFRSDDHSDLFLYQCPTDLAKARSTLARKVIHHEISAAPATPESRFRIPLHGSAPAHTVARYLSLTICFSGRSEAAPNEEPRLGSPWEPPEGIPFAAIDIPFRRQSAASLKTFGAGHLLTLPFVSLRPSSYTIGWISDGLQAALILNPVGEITREVGAPAGAYSLELPNATLLDVVNQAARPLRAEVRQNGAGDPYVACAVSSEDDRLGRANSKRVMIFLSQQTLSDIALAAGSNAAALTIAPARTWREESALVIRVEGLRETGGEMERFSTIVDTGTASNADAH